MQRPDCILAPVTIDELRDAIDPRSRDSPYRASDKGFLTVSTAEYLSLLDWSARIVMAWKAGATPSDLPPILERFGLSTGIWIGIATRFSRLYPAADRKPEVVEQARSLHRGQPYDLTNSAKTLFASSS